MKATLAAAISLSLAVQAAKVNTTDTLTSRTILSDPFKPPPVFKNVNLFRSINLEKGYPRETINVVIENVDSKPQDEYYLPFPEHIFDKVGAFEARDKNAPTKGSFVAEPRLDLYGYVEDAWLLDAVETSSDGAFPRRDTQYYRIHLSEPLKPSGQQTLSISYVLLSSLHPLPASISQAEKQFLIYSFSAYTPSAYPTSKQKTKLQFPSPDVAEYPPGGGASRTKPDPVRQGASITHGPYADIPAGAVEPVKYRYEFTKPLIHASRLERDVEVSHWGGNLATEERYWLVNGAANLSTPFSRAVWTQTMYYNPPTTALKGLMFPLRLGASDPYFVDDIGNVSTSRFRSNIREATLELKPRYPVFGGGRYSFRVGWNAHLKGYLRKLARGDGYVLKVPFLEGPRMAEGVEYEKVVVRVILPEGARYVCSLP